MAIIDVIKYNGNADVFAWKHPSEELGTWTQLIVNESQEAILFKSGKALDIFCSGRHTLSTANIPLLNNLINLPFGGRSPFTAEVWYINKTSSLDIKWGTATPIQLQDPKYGVFVPVCSFGQFGIQIEESKRFLLKLVGTLPIFDKNNITTFFRGLYLTKVKDAISSYLIHKKISILEMNAYLNELSEHLKESMQPTLEEYGIKLINFFVNDINVPDDDPTIKKLKDALAKRAEMDIIGYSYQQERSFDTLEGAVSNNGSTTGDLLGAGLGLGMGVGLGGTVGAQFQNIGKEVSTGTANTIECPNCHAKVDKNKRFCCECGFDTQKEKTESNQNVIKCSRCGATLSNTTKFCPECGDKYNPCQKCGADLPEGAVKCDSCGYKLPLPCPSCGKMLEDVNIKFCPECGVSLVQKCKKCNAVLNGDSKFCPECGENLKN